MPLVLTGLIAAGIVVVPGLLTGRATAQPPSSGNGAKRFDDLRELNNKLARAITRVDSELASPPHPHGWHVQDPARWRRTLHDLEVTKLRAVDQFPPVFGLAYGKTFRQLSCIDEQIAVSDEMMILLEGPTRLRILGDWLTRRGENDVSQAMQHALKSAKACKDTLETELAGVSVPSGITDDLRELNNKLSRAITRVDSELASPPHPHGWHVQDPARWRRTLRDLEVTKLRAVDQFPEILDPPYGESFRQLSCIDEQIAVSDEMMILLEGPTSLRILGDWLTRRGENDVSQVMQHALRRAKACKDTVEIELMHSFDLKPGEQTQGGVKATTPSGTDMQNPKKLNAPKPLQTAYARDGFVGRHERDYVAIGVNAGNPDSWPQGQNVLFFDVFDLFGSAKGAQKANQASQQNLKSNGFSLVRDSSLGSGETVFQKQAAGSPLLSTIIYVERGTFIMKLAGSCKSCSRGSVESSLKSLAQTQLAQAVSNGFPTGTTGAAREEWQVSGASRSQQDPFNLCIYIKGPAGQTGTVSTRAGSPDFQSQVPPQQKLFTLNASGVTELVFTEPPASDDGPNGIAFTIARNEPDGSVAKSGTQWSDAFQPPPWGLPACTPPG